MSSETQKPRHRCRALIALAALLCTAPSCVMMEGVGRSIGESLGLVTPPPPKQGYGEPISVPGPVKPKSESR